MAQYFFHRIDGQRDPDLEGLDLPSLELVKSEAFAFAADTLKKLSTALWDGGHVRIEVVDETQAPVFTIEISTVDEMMHRPSNDGAPS